MAGMNSLGTVWATLSWAMLNCVYKTCTDEMVSCPNLASPASDPDHELLHLESCEAFQKMDPCNIIQ